MSNRIWIIDPDQDSAQAMRNALDLLGPEIETMPAFERRDEAPKAILIAGAIGIDAIEANIAALRRMGGDDLLPITIIGGVQGNAEALALGADHFLPSPVMLGELVDHLLRFMPMEDPEDFERILPESRGLPESGDLPEPEAMPEPEAGASEAAPDEDILDLDQVSALLNEIGDAGEGPEPDEAILDGDQIAAMMAQETESDEAILDGDQIAAMMAQEPDSDEAILDGDQIAVMMAQEPQSDEAILDGDQIAAMMAQETESDEAILDGDQIAAMMAQETDSDEAILDGDQIAAMMAQETDSDEAILDGDQIAAMMAQEPQSDEAILDSDQIAAMMPHAQVEPMPQTPRPEVVEAGRTEATIPPDEEPLFGLKQPKETQVLSDNVPNEPISWAEDRPQTDADLASDSAWGLDGEADSDGGTDGWSTADAGWDASGDDGGWGDSGGDGGWDDASESSDGDGWGDESGDDDGWGGNDEGWGDSGGDDAGWGDDGQSGGWGQAAAPKSKSTDLKQLGAQLIADQPQPRAPVGKLGLLPPTGLLGLLTRCGADRVTGRVDLQQSDLRLSMQFRDGRITALASPSLDELVLQSAFAQGWLDHKELAAVRHLQHRRHCSAAAVMSREGLRDGDALQALSQDCAERLLLRAAQHNGGRATYRAELATMDGIGLSELDSQTRVIETAKNLVGSPVYNGVIGGDDAAPESTAAPLPKTLPGRQAFEAADGETSLFELATTSATPIAELRAGCLAGVALGAIELRRVGAAQLQASQRPDKSYHRMLAQIRSGDYFAVLGLADAHSEAEVQRAYASRIATLRQYLATNHPQFVELAEELAEAKEVLLDPDLRAQYRTAKPSVEA